MAVTQTGAMYKSLSFDNTSSRSYGVYITGEAVYNAPERAVEMISIPGRNGAFALDEGRFENIEVTYPAGIFADTEADFAQAVSDFRNFLCSKKGYCRLTDEYNPNEYRMAVYKSGLEVDPAQLRAGQFDITFECKPQRFLTSGETKATATNGGTITNPTLFASKPLLEVKGYGTVTMNGYPVTLENIVLGDVQLIPAGSANPFFSKSYGTGLVNTGDTITVSSGSRITITLRAASTVEIVDVMLTNTGGVYSVNSTNDTSHITIWVDFPAETFTAGTNKTVSSSFTALVSHRWGGGAEQFETITFTPAIEYTASTRTFKLSCSYTPNPSFTSSVSRLCECQNISANSSVSALGNPSYIDCEIGEAYKIVNNEIVSLNNAVSIGNALPELSPGSNSVTFPNTITEVKYTPRWWKI